MFFHVILTTECNLECVYCHGKSCGDMDSDWDRKKGIRIDYGVPPEPVWKVNDLKTFVEKDPEAWVSFYGGEPTLRLDLIREIMDSVKCKGFLMQTNCMLLDRLESRYVNRFHTILVSLDGRESTTDSNRGKGVYRKVMDMCRLIRKNGYRGELIARMVIGDGMDVEKEVKHLVEAGFTSVHWQLDANFWEHDFMERDFKGWSENVYNPGIRRLVKFWVDRMEEGTVLKLYPFLAVMEDLLKGQDTPGIRCGAGWSNFAVLTDGNISPCPVMQGMVDFYCGNLTSSPENLLKIRPTSPCIKEECDILGLCGGRCLYANKTKHWGEKGLKEVCGTVENLVKCLKKELPGVRKLVSKGTVSLSDFEHLRYNGCEIIP